MQHGQCKQAYQGRLFKLLGDWQFDTYNVTMLHVYICFLIIKLNIFNICQKIFQLSLHLPLQLVGHMYLTPFYVLSLILVIGYSTFIFHNLTCTCQYILCSHTNKTYHINCVFYFTYVSHFRAHFRYCSVKF